jgi:lipoprotein-releasing system permease protein
VSRRLFPSRLERRIAIRYLRGRTASRFTSLNTRIATAGVAIGVAALIVVLGIMNGLHNDLRDKILVGNPHLHVLTYGASLRMDNWRDALEVVRADPDVVAATPEVIEKSLIMNTSQYAAAVDVLGLDPDTSAAAVITLPRAIDGDLSFTVSSDSVDGAIVLGARLASRLNAYKGDIVTLIPKNDLSRINRTVGRPTWRYWFFEVTGTFNTGMFQYDDGFAVMRLDVAQRFAGLGEAVSGIQVRVRDPWAAPAVAARLSEQLGYPFRTVAWQEQNQSLFGALKLEKLGMGLIITFITIVAAFNIIGTLTMIVGEKTREIGILMAMGLTRRSIGRIFLAQGASIGLVGTAIGLVLGIGVGLVLNSSQVIRIDPSIYFIDHLPVQVEPLDIGIVVLVASTIALLATLPTSRWAARLEPVEAIRHE